MIVEIMIDIIHLEARLDQRPAQPRERSVAQLVARQQLLTIREMVVQGVSDTIAFRHRVLDPYLDSTGQGAARPLPDPLCPVPGRGGVTAVKGQPAARA